MLWESLKRRGGFTGLNGEKGWHMKYSIGLLVLAVACGDAGTGLDPADPIQRETAALSSKDFDVQFTDCTVFAGLARVSMARARALVPAEYTLFDDGGSARMVVRVAECAGTVVDGHQQGTTLVSHIGIGLVGPDTTVNLNNYTLWYATSSALLHARLKAAGVRADKSNAISLTYEGGTLGVSSSSAHTPSFVVTGPADLGTGAPAPTSASWWDNGKRGAIRSRTVLPVIQFGTASTVLTTPANSELAALIGGTTLTFDVLDSYNLFPSGTMEVRDTD
jgi:hypothetical protein